MIKICSLDFLNREVFDTDIMSADGKIVCKTNDKVTPDKLLKLYFQELFAEVDLCELERNREKEEQEKFWREEEEKQEKARIEEELKKKAEKKIYAKLEETKPEQELVDEKEIAKQLIFDEDRAKRIQAYATLMAKAIKLPTEKMKELEQVAYYYNVGRSQFNESDLTRKGFKKRQAAASYEMLLNEMNFAPHMAEVAELYLVPYDSKEFKLEKHGGTEVPYQHIVAIADYYEELMSKTSKEEALLKMIQLGGNRFNIFVLHKFVEIMRRSDG